MAKVRTVRGSAGIVPRCGGVSAVRRSEAVVRPAAHDEHES
jgi:hypothetical protein